MRQHPSKCEILMKKGKEVKISYWAAHATTIVSVTLVLLMIGLIALVSISARNETRRLKESLEMSVIMTDSVSDTSAAEIAKSMQSLPFCRNITLISSKDALEEWKTDTGEDLEALFGVNPLSPEISFTMPAQYSTADSLKIIRERMLIMPGVEDVAAPDNIIIASMNDNIARLSLILGCIALVMLIISFVLINNTVHLTIYARRFIIHTMQLVGATDGFIRRPIVSRNLLAGSLAGLFASVILAAILFAAPRFGFNDISDYFGWELFIATAAMLILLGGCICSMAALMATRHYLHKDYHQLVTSS